MRGPLAFGVIEVMPYVTPAEPGAPSPASPSGVRCIDSPPGGATLRCSLATVVLLAIISTPAAGQTAFYVEGGALTAPGFSEFQAGLRGSPAKLEGTGLDFSVSTLPAHFSEGLVLVISDLDVAIHRPLGPRIAVSARLGGTALFGSGGGTSGAALGIGAGAGLIFSVGSTMLLRLDFTHRWLMSGGTTVGISSITLGIGVGN